MFIETTEQTVQAAINVLVKKLADSTNNTKRDEFVLENLNILMRKQCVEHYPLGTLCRIWHGTEYDHIIIGHIQRQNELPLIQVIKINPTAQNDLYVNLECHDVHLRGDKQ